MRQHNLLDWDAVFNFLLPLKGRKPMSNGAATERVVEAIASQSHRFRGGVYAGSAETFMERRQQGFRKSAKRLPEDYERADLVRVIRRFL